MQTLYELDFRRELQEKNLDDVAVLKRNIDRYSEVLEDKKFIDDLVNGILTRVEELDAFIQPIAPDWPLDQIARIDRTILRMGVYELIHGTDVPSKVIINEAVELAKAFGADNSSKFINGVLGTAFKQLEEAQSKIIKSTPKKAPSKSSKSKKDTKK